MSRAEKQRLLLLCGGEGLLLSFDETQIKPFGVRFVNTEMVLTHHGKDVASVPKEINSDEQVSDLMVFSVKNDSVDEGIKNVLASLTNHLDVVEKIFPQELRLLKQQREEDARTAEALEKRKRANGSTFLASLFSDEAPDPHRVVSKRDLNDATLLSSAKYPVRITECLNVHQNVFHMFLADVETVSFSFQETEHGYKPHMFYTHYPDGSRNVHPDQKDFVDHLRSQHLNAGKICEAVEALAARNRHALDPARFIADVATLPKLLYNVNTWLMHRSPYLEYGHMHLTGDLSMLGYNDSFHMYREDMPIASFNLGFFSGPLTDVPAKLVMPRYRYNEREIQVQALGLETLETLISTWISVMAHHNPDNDFSVYERVGSAL